MARKYTKVEQLTSIIGERAGAGETYREIGTALSLTCEQVREVMHRLHARERKIAAVYIPHPKGRPRKEATSEEERQRNELARLRMQVELLRKLGSSRKIEGLTKKGW